MWAEQSCEVVLGTNCIAGGLILVKQTTLQPKLQQEQQQQQEFLAGPRTAIVPAAEWKELVEVI
jgi:hypothetical protein